MLNFSLFFSRNVFSTFMCILYESISIKILKHYFHFILKKKNHNVQEDTKIKVFTSIKCKIYFYFYNLNHID